MSAWMVVLYALGYVFGGGFVLCGLLALAYAASDWLRKLRRKPAPNPRSDVEEAMACELVVIMRNIEGRSHNGRANCGCDGCMPEVEQLLTRIRETT